jgi:DNA-binding MarR family transcriptional regulator
VFDGIVDMGGSASPSDFEALGFESTQAFRGQVKALEDAQLVESSVDDSDKRRRLIEVTSRGWIVRYQRSGYELPEARL